MSWIEDFEQAVGDAEIVPRDLVSFGAKFNLLCLYMYKALDVAYMISRAWKVVALVIP